MWSARPTGAVSWATPERIRTRLRKNRGVADQSGVRTRVGNRELTLTNLDKVLYPHVGFTKAEVIAYYSASPTRCCPTSPTGR